MGLSLRPATTGDRRQVYEWLARSDATAQMMGPPDFRDHPVPDYREFCADYDDEAFAADGNFRIFIMVAEGREIGAIHYWVRDRIAEVDLWIGNREDWGRGYGSSAIRLVAGMLERQDVAGMMIIRPSARNCRAIAAYRKAGFVPHDPARHELPGWCLTEGLDYADAVVLVWVLATEMNSVEEPVNVAGDGDCRHHG